MKSAGIVSATLLFMMAGQVALAPAFADRGRVAPMGFQCETYWPGYHTAGSLTVGIAAYWDCQPDEPSFVGPRLQGGESK